MSRAAPARRLSTESCRPSAAATACWTAFELGFPRQCLRTCRTEGRGRTGSSAPRYSSKGRAPSRWRSLPPRCLTRAGRRRRPARSRRQQKGQRPQLQPTRPSVFAETPRRDLGGRETPNPRAGIRELFRQEEASLVRPTPCGSAASPPPSRRLDSTRCRCGGIDSQLQRHVRRHDNQSLQFLRRSRPGLATTLRFPPYLMMFPDPPPLI